MKAQFKRFVKMLTLSVGAYCLAAGGVVQGQAIGDDGYLFVTSWNNASVYRYDTATGAFVDAFVPRRSGGLYQPWDACISPHDGNLLVSYGHFGGVGQRKGVLRYDGTTGEFIDEFVPSGQLIMPHAVTFGPDSNLYIGEQTVESMGSIARFNGVTGEFIDYFVAPGSGGLGHPLAHVFGPDNNGDGELDLYVSDEHTGNVLHYDGTNGDFLGVFVEFGSGGLGSPFGLVFGPYGNLYVADTALFGGVRGILRYQGPAGPTPGAFIDEFVPANSGGLLEPLGMLFGPDANGDGEQDLYANSQAINPNSYQTQPHTSSVKRYDGITGTYIDDFIPIDSNGGLQGPGLMTFTHTDPVTLEYVGN